MDWHPLGTFELQKTMSVTVYFTYNLEVLKMKGQSLACTVSLIVALNLKLQIRADQSSQIDSDDHDCHPVGRMQ